MKFKELVEKIDKSPANESSVNLNSIAENEFNIFNLSWEACIEHESKLKAYWVQNWFCTDSFVGWRLYFLEGEFVASSMQWGRKCCENFDWVSTDALLKVKDFLLSMTVDEQNFNGFSFFELEQELEEENYSLDFTEQLLTSHNSKAILNGEPVTIVRQIQDESKQGSWGNNKIEILNKGEKQVVEISDLKFSYYTVEERNS